MTSTQQQSPCGKRRPSEIAATEPRDRRATASTLSGSPFDGPGGAEARRHGVELVDLLPGEPARLVELVHAHVDGDAAAAGAEGGRRRRSVPLPAGNPRDLAEVARRDPLAKVHELGHEAPPIADLQRDPRGGGRRRRLARLVRAQAARLLAEHRHACRGEARDERDVQVRGRGDEHRVEAARRQELVDVGVGRKPPRSGRLARGRVKARRPQPPRHARRCAARRDGRCPCAPPRRPRGAGGRRSGPRPDRPGDQTASDDADSVPLRHVRSFAPPPARGRRADPRPGVAVQRGDGLPFPVPLVRTVPARMRTSIAPQRRSRLSG